MSDHMSGHGTLEALCNKASQSIVLKAKINNVISGWF